jgi:hypothetical protein
MPNIEMGAEALVAGREQMFDRIESGGFHHVDHHRRRQHPDAPGPDAGCGLLLAHEDSRVAG